MQTLNIIFQGCITCIYNMSCSSFMEAENWIHLTVDEGRVTFVYLETGVYDAQTMR
jgi:hypothetical protein